MIRFFVRQSNQGVLGFEVTGHAGYGEHGTDIVCAGVSALVYNAVNSCERLLGTPLEASDTTEKLRCYVPKEHQLNPEVQLLLKSLVFGVEQIAETYPGNVKIQYRHETE